VPGGGALGGGGGGGLGHLHPDACRQSKSKHSTCSEPALACLNPIPEALKPETCSEPALAASMHACTHASLYPPPPTRAHREGDTRTQIHKDSSLPALEKLDAGDAARRPAAELLRAVCQ